MQEAWLHTGTDHLWGDSQAPLNVAPKPNTRKINTHVAPERTSIWESQVHLTQS